ncbi:MAG TPA: DUF5615 family PIN-like protein [Candidatus Saccharimonadales bacterium]|nr:DUF5615 family PIN-like protein [Candidatus Saccharimonadales bacterium]
MKFYVDECLPEAIADRIMKQKGYTAFHAKRDLGYGNREDEFHVAESRRRNSILITSNHKDFKKGPEYLKKHPGIVVLIPNKETNKDDLLEGVNAMFMLFRSARIFGKPPLRNDLKERRFVISTERAYVEDVNGFRFDLYPIVSDDWYRIPKKKF